MRETDQYRSTVYPEVSPAVVEMKCPEGLLTPPSSNRKPFEHNSNLDLEPSQSVKNT